MCTNLLIPRYGGGGEGLVTVQDDSSHVLGWAWTWGGGVGDRDALFPQCRLVEGMVYDACTNLYCELQHCYIVVASPYVLL